MPSYSPPWCTHVVGTYPAREYEKNDDGTQTLVPMRIDMVCNHVDPKTNKRCGATWRHTCNTGAVHQWIQKFALQHVHRDPMRVKPSGAT